MNLDLAIEDPRWGKKQAAQETKNNNYYYTHVVLTLVFLCNIVCNASFLLFGFGMFFLFFCFFSDRPCSLLNVSDWNSLEVVGGGERRGGEGRNNKQLFFFALMELRCNWVCMWCL
jgi:hypothetical protein